MKLAARDIFPLVLILIGVSLFAYGVANAIRLIGEIEESENREEIQAEVKLQDITEERDACMRMLDEDEQRRVRGF